MQQIKLSQTNVQNCETIRTKQSDDLELFAAICEAESAHAAWVADQRIGTDHDIRVHPS